MPPGLGEYISGSILFEETLYDNAATGEPFVELMKKQGIIPGIKTDKGLVPLANSNNESWTQGLTGLADRSAEYYKQVRGARRCLLFAICDRSKKNSPLAATFLNLASQLIRHTPSLPSSSSSASRAARHSIAVFHISSLQGARFAKWRAVVSIPAGPSPHAVTEAAYGLARYAAISQNAGLVPIVEPEVLLDGDHDIERTFEARGRSLPPQPHH